MTALAERGPDGRAPEEFGAFFGVLLPSGKLAGSHGAEGPDPPDLFRSRRIADSRAQSMGGRTVLVRLVEGPLFAGVPTPTDEDLEEEAT